MANKEHVERLRLGVAVWNKWREKNPDIPLDLGGADLSRANLRRANLGGADLRWADLSEADLSEADLSEADLSEADLGEADLSRANLRGANLGGANLGGADLRWADLSEADLSEADLGEADLSEADLSEADLSEADLSGADLGEADLSEADLSRANLSGADLGEADLSGAKGLLQSEAWLYEHFEITDEGIIAYKAFGLYHLPPPQWVIEANSMLHEECNIIRTDNCGSGINVATREWIKTNMNYQSKQPAIWKVLIPWRENLGSICVPYDTDGKFRCANIMLLEIVKEASDGDADTN